MTTELVVRVPVIDPPIYIAVWRVDVGTIPLYLLDTDIPENDPVNRMISHRLYIDGNELRLKQEIVWGLAEVMYWTYLASAPPSST